MEITPGAEDERSKRSGFNVLAVLAVTCRMPYLFADNYAAAAALVSNCSPFRDDALQNSQVADQDRLGCLQAINCNRVAADIRNRNSFILVHVF
jgi:hypothetical protein